MVQTQSYPVLPGELKHYGVMGMKWGVRKDGRPQGYQGGKRGKGKTGASLSKTRGTATVSKAQSSSSSEGSTVQRKGLSEKQKKALAIGAAVAGTALAAYGTYKVGNALATSRITANTAKSVRQKDILDAALASAAKNKANNEAKKQVAKERRDFAKNVMTKSDKEVEAYVKRLSNEKKARDLTDELVSPGRTFAKSTAKTVARKVAPAAATAATTAAIGYTVSKATSSNPKDKKEESERRKTVARNIASDTRKLVTKK